MSGAVIAMVPADDALAPMLIPLADHAAEHLDLARWLAAITLVADDLEDDERPWFDLAREGERRALTVYLHPDAVLKDHPRGIGPRAQRPAWELSAPPPAPAPPAVDSFSPVKAQRVLHHLFLLVRDLCDGSLTPADVPSSLAEAFQEAWAVTVDGRLRRAGWPGLSEGERRIRFLRLFATGGVVTPAHWQVFHELWTGEAAVQAEVLRRVRRLPPLPRRGIAV